MVLEALNGEVGLIDLHASGVDLAYTGSFTSVDPGRADTRGIPLLAVADIADPIELESRTGFALGSYVMCHQTSGTQTRARMYVLGTSSTAATGAPFQYRVTAENTYWIQVAGTQQADGPVGATNNYLAVFDGATGRLLKAVDPATVSGPPSGPAGGVLSGTYPNPGWADFSDRFRLLGSNDTDGTPGEVDLDVTLTMTGSTLKVADNSIGPTQIDQAAAYTWSGDSEFSGNNLFSNSNTFQGNDDHSGVPSFTNAAGPKFSGITKHVVPLPTASNQVLTSGTGTPTVTLTAANATTSGRVNVSVVFAGAGTLRVYIPLGQVPYQFLGRLITIQDVIHTMTKTSGGNATSKVDNVGVAGFAGTANSNTITASDVALDATDRHTTAAPTAVTTTNATITPAQLGGALALYFCFDIVSTTNQTVAVSVNLGAADHTEVHITEAN